MATLDRGENALLSGNEYKVVVIGKLHVLSVSKHHSVIGLPVSECVRV
jgi:hypothetical protein